MIACLGGNNNCVMEALWIIKTIYYNAALGFSPWVDPGYVSQGHQSL